jgi:hypothetical protein
MGSLPSAAAAQNRIKIFCVERWNSRDSILISDCAFRGSEWDAPSQYGTDLLAFADPDHPGGLLSSLSSLCQLPA